MQELVNKKFGKWTVITYEGKRGTIRHWYTVKCECGNESVVERSTLTRSKSTRCKPCARKEWHEVNDNPSHKHGYSSLTHPYFRVYTAWCTMKSRCYREKDKNYISYGAKGVTVCDEWRDSFETFLEDMDHPPEGYTLDRINVYGNYCKENCRWADNDTQKNNCRRTIYHEMGGHKLSESQWARKLGLSRNKVMIWARKQGIQWVSDNLETLKEIKRIVKDDDFERLGLELPAKRFR